MLNFLLLLFNRTPGGGGRFSSQTTPILGIFGTILGTILTTGRQGEVEVGDFLLGPLYFSEQFSPQWTQLWT